MAGSAYYYRMRDDPEFKRKRKEYSAKRQKTKQALCNAESRAWALANPERTREIEKASRDRNKLKAIFRNVRKRAKARGMEFDLDLSDLEVPEVCPVFNVPFVLNATWANCDFSPSVDRIDSSKGYVKGNVQVISRLANCMKWTATPEQLVAFSTAMLKRHA